MIELAKYVVNFSGIVKNRLGPYKMVLRSKDGYATFKKPDHRTNNKENAIGFISNILITQTNWSEFKKTTFTICLLTRAGDIELSKKDIVKEMQDY